MISSSLSFVYFKKIYISVHYEKPSIGHFVVVFVTFIFIAFLSPYFSEVLISPCQNNSLCVFTVYILYSCSHKSPIWHLQWVIHNTFLRLMLSTGIQTKLLELGALS